MYVIVIKSSEEQVIMSKRIVICADGTWNRPEEDLSKDRPTNVLRLARAIKQAPKIDKPQHVFYDWGVGSYYARVAGGVTGLGLHKNIMDDYRYIVQNFNPGDEIWLFGFSRGAYTVRSLCGLINNCGILRREYANRVSEAFGHYKSSNGDWAPKGKKSRRFRRSYSHDEPKITFVGVWDTVGALGIPKGVLGLFRDQDEFYDNKLGSNVGVARHALAIDEQREDFEPTLWEPRGNLDLKQVWFTGAHADVGGSDKPGKRGTILSDIPLKWMIKEAQHHGLRVESHLQDSLRPDPQAPVHHSRRSFYRLRGKHIRPIALKTIPRRKGEEPKSIDFLIHKSVREKWEKDSKYRPQNLRQYLKDHGWPRKLET